MRSTAKVNGEDVMLGNYFLDADNRVVFIRGMIDKDTVVINGDGYYPVDKLFAIPVRHFFWSIGFSKVWNGQIYNGDDMSIRLESNEHEDHRRGYYIYADMGDGEVRINSAPIYFIHELQNIMKWLFKIQFDPMLVLKTIKNITQ